MVRNLNSKKIIISILFFMLLCNYDLYADSTPVSNKKKLKISSREIIWAITHPFIANKVLKITKKALKITDSLENYNILFDRSGGNLDAFKHAYWMALLSQNISRNKARKIGVIHEKINYREYKRGISAQDSAASLMDLKNNEIGISIIENNKFLSHQELINTIIEAINNGELYRIKKNKKGEYLDSNNQVIDLSKENGWNKRKCIVRTY